MSNTSNSGLAMRGSIKRGERSSIDSISGERMYGVRAFGDKI